jgi:transcriptional regulator with XRE-family HTH domain
MDLTVGRNLKKLREANRFSQEQVSSFLNITRSAYANYEAGVREAPLSVLEKAASLFGCALSVIFEENDTALDNMLICAFRVDGLSREDMQEVASFKNIVINYLKMNRLLNE